MLERQRCISYGEKPVPKTASLLLICILPTRIVAAYLHCRSTEGPRALNLSLLIAAISKNLAVSSRTYSRALNLTGGTKTNGRADLLHQTDLRDACLQAL